MFLFVILMATFLAFLYCKCMKENLCPLSLTD
jgi:hypothetical protein